MRNKLLVSVFAVGLAAFALTSCETKDAPDVTAVCSDMVKESLHKSARSLLLLDGEVLTMEEYEFLGGVNDNRLLYRTIKFGNGVYEPKSVDTMTYEYGEWQEQNTTFTLHVTPSTGLPYTLLYRGNAFITPEGHIIGGEGLNNAARVEKWEKALNTFPNTKWEATFRGEFVMDSVFRDSIRTTFIPPATYKKDTIQIFTGKMDTLSADTTCQYIIEFKHDATTNATTGHLYQKSVRSTYNRETKEETIVNQEIKEYDYNWFFTEVSSDSKFMIQLKSTTPGIEGEKLNISKYKNDGTTVEFLLKGLTFKPYVAVP
jgi:hypothetical protein